MGMSGTDYLSQLQALLPKGPAWPREPAALLTRLLDAFADEFARIDARADQLIDEADPRTTYELLADWERVAGLPGTCALLAGINLTIEQRRSALVTKLTGRGGQSRAYFIALAARLGFTVTISEYRPYRVTSCVNDPICGEDWIFVWQINSALNTVHASTVGMAVNDPLRNWGNELLECAISQDKPAHTTVLFAYQ